MKEFVVLVDDTNQAIGTAPKDAVHTATTPLHRAFSLFLFNSAGEVLLQQRSRRKKTWPLMWSNSCCGHPLPNEEVEVAVRRRAAFELGITEIEKLENILPDFRYRAERDGIVEYEICPVFMGFTNLNVRANPSEVEQYGWKPWAAFLTEMQQFPERYSEWCRWEAELLKEKLA